VENFFNEQSMAAAKSLSDHFSVFHVPDCFSSPSLSGRLRHKYYMHRPGMTGFRANREDRNRFQNLLKEHDLVWFHTPASAIPFEPLQKCRCVMDLDDLMHLKLQLQSEQTSSLRLRLSARVQAFKWRHIEMAAPARYTGVAVCSEKDRGVLGSTDNVYVIPNGFVCPEIKPAWSPPDGLRLGFIGALTYPPNLKGLEWFARQVWPLIRSARPDIRLRVIGTLPPNAPFLHTTEGFEPLGYVEDPSMEFKTWTAMIVPLLVGGGTRIKILEAFSRLCPVISTSVGAYGLEVEDTKNILLADAPQYFARQCLTLCGKPEMGHILAEQGWDLFTHKYTWERIGRHIRTVVEKCLEVK
jgi:glycosyltransferase involved in cell wall biosynthesis